MPHPSLAPFESSWLWLSLVTLVVLLTLAGWGWAAYQWLPGLRLNSEPVAFAAECLLLGVVGFSLLGFGGIHLRVPLHDTFLAGTAAVVLVAFSWRRRWRQGRPAALGLTQGIRSPSALLLLAVVLTGAGSVLWSVSSFPGLAAREGGIVLVPWVDFFFHARQIGDFAHFASDPEALNPMMAGRPLPTYHYGSYMVPALVAKLAGASSIQVATSLYPVLGLALTGVAMLVLAQSTAGAGAALLAVGLLFLLPDGSFWQAEGSPSQSYFFLQQVGGGGACAVAIMGWALACACQGFSRRSWPLCGFALLLFGLATMFKMQIVLAYGGFFAVFVVAGAPWRSRPWAWAAGVACGVTFAAVASRLRPFPQAPTFTLVPGPVALLPAPPAPGWSPLLEIWALYGTLLPMAAVLVWTLRKDALARRMARLLLLNLVAFACVRFLIADSRDFGALGEINRRTFVWPYFVMVYGCAVLLWRWLQTRAWAKAWKLSIVAASGLGLAAQAARSAALLQCWPGVGPGLTNVPIAGGLVESAAYLKLHSAPHETLQPCQSDAYNELAALAERPVYVSGPNVEALASPGGAAERMRLGVVQQVVKAARREDAVSALEQAGIAWFVMSPDCQAPWQTQWTPAWQASGYRIYKVPPVKAPV